VPAAAGLLEAGRPVESYRRIALDDALGLLCAGRAPADLDHSRR
jgi:hypothetical protein